jgi:hypothetical protein
VILCGEGVTLLSNAFAHDISWLVRCCGASRSDQILTGVYVGTNGCLYLNMQNFAGSSASYVGETAFAGDSAKDVAVGRNQDSTPEIFTSAATSRSQQTTHIYFQPR